MFLSHVEAMVIRRDISIVVALAPKKGRFHLINNTNNELGLVQPSDVIIIILILILILKIILIIIMMMMMMMAMMMMIWR